MELAQHIEALLLENDCVIVPGLGGFIAHSTPARRVEEEDIFLPPSRTIGFNPQLKLNDGVLVQSYMEVYATNFSDATKMVEKEVNELIALLHEEGKAELENVGELHYTIYDTYEFYPYNNKITTPLLYGLDSFQMKKLSDMVVTKEKVLIPTVLIPEKKSYEIKFNRAYLRNVAAMIAAIILFFAFSIPVKNTDVQKNNYAQLLPTDLFEKMENQSLVLTPVEVKQQASPKKKAVASRQERKITSQDARTSHPIAVKEIKVPTTPQSAKPAETKTPATSSATPPVQVTKTAPKGGNFHLIVAGGIGLKSAEAIAEQLRGQGYPTAKALNTDGKVRVSIMSCTTRQEAAKQLMKLRENDKYKNAWMLAL